MKINKAHKIKLNPTKEQEAYFIRASGVARFAWNWSLDRYKTLKESNQQADWNQIKKDFRNEGFSFVKEVTKCAAEQGISDLRKSINVYYKVKKSNPKSDVKFPGLRKRSKKIGSFGISNDKFYFKEQDVYIPRLGFVNMTEKLRFDGRVLSGRVKESAGNWYLIVVVEVEQEKVEINEESIGIDFGLKTFAALSNAEIVETQNYFRKLENRLKGLNRGLSRKKKGSNNRKKWKLKLVKCYEKIKNQRLDFLNKFSNEVTKNFGIIFIEDLNLKGLCKTKLAKSFYDVGIGEAVKQLEYKSSWKNGIVQKVDRFFPSSKLCSCCGWKNEELKLSDRTWICQNCNTAHDRDLNAAINIKLEGMRLLAGSVATSASTPVDMKALV